LQIVASIAAGTAKTPPGGRPTAGPSRGPETTPVADGVMSLLGRPRCPAIDDEARGAAIGLIVESGYSGLTMGGVAKRAGVSKAALYRRWPNKLSLIVDAIEAFAHAQVAVPDTGHVRDDMAGYLQNFVQAQRDYAGTVAAISDALSSEPELAARCRGTLLASFSANVETIVVRGVGRGELAGTTDVELLASVVPALIRFWRQSTGQLLDEALIERIANQFFDPSTASPPS
jgi:AcrR family transcriptional regulator